MISVVFKVSSNLVVIVFQTGRPARHGHEHGEARHGEARRHAVPCLIVSSCRVLGPGTALWPVSRAVSCRWARQPACLPVPPCQLEAARRAIVVASELGDAPLLPPMPHRRRVGARGRRPRRAPSCAPRTSAVVARPELLVVPSSSLLSSGAGAAPRAAARSSWEEAGGDGEERVSGGKLRRGEKMKGEREKKKLGFWRD